MAYELSKIDFGGPLQMHDQQLHRKSTCQQEALVLPQVRLRQIVLKQKQ